MKGGKYFQDSRATFEPRGDCVQRCHILVKDGQRVSKSIINMDGEKEAYVP